MQNLPPVVTVGVGVCSTKNSLVAVSFKEQLLMPLVLRCNYIAVKTLLEELKGKTSDIDDPVPYYDTSLLQLTLPS